MIVIHLSCYLNIVIKKYQITWRLGCFLHLYFCRINYNGMFDYNLHHLSALTMCIQEKIIFDVFLIWKFSFLTSLSKAPTENRHRILQCSFFLFVDERTGNKTMCGILNFSNISKVITQTIRIFLNNDIFA